MQRLALAGVAALLAACASREHAAAPGTENAEPPGPRKVSSEPTLRAYHGAMGTLFELVVRGADAETARSAAHAAFAEIDRTDRALSVWDPRSELSALNAASDRAPTWVPVGEILAEALDRAATWSERTTGAFDVTVGALVEAYGLREGRIRPLEAEELDRVRELVGSARLLRVDLASQRAWLGRAGLRLDLDAIGKGIAVDRALAVLRGAGIRDALLSGGGSTIAALGPPAGVPAHGVTIVGPDEEPLEEVELRDEALSTSGNWRRSAAVGGELLGHVVDPRTGRLVGGRLRSATIVCRSAADSDALATACLVVGAERARALASSFGARAILVVEGDDGSRSVRK